MADTHAPEHYQLVVEYLSFRMWIARVTPWVLRCRWDGRVIIDVSYVDASPMGYRCARWFGYLLRTASPVARFSFRLIDLRDAQGLLLSIRIAAQDIAELQHAISTESRSVRLLARWCGDDAACARAVTKDVAAVSYAGQGTLWRAMLLIHACHQHARGACPPGAPVLFLEQRPWFDALRRYAERYGVRLVAVPSRWTWSAVVDRMIGAHGMLVLRMARNWLHAFRMRLREQHPIVSGTIPRDDRSGACIAVEYSGQMSLDVPGRYSDLFFYQQSALAGSDLLLLFPFPQDPLDDEKWGVLTRHGIRAAALYPGASTVTSVPPFSCRLPLRSVHLDVPRGRTRSRDERWVRGKAEAFRAQRLFWQSFFSAEGVRVYVSWYRYDTRHHAMTAAIRALGGVGAIYQRAVQDYPSPAIAVEADVMFGYAPFDATIERQSGSVIPYHVAVGYLHDQFLTALRGI